MVFLHQFRRQTGSRQLAMDNLSPEQLAALRADDRGPLCERIVIAFTVMSFVSVCSRLFARIRYHKTGWEDWTIVVAMVRKQSSV